MAPVIAKKNSGIFRLASRGKVVDMEANDDEDGFLGFTDQDVFSSSSSSQALPTSVDKAKAVDLVLVHRQSRSGGEGLATFLK
jgi:hypothetical protein